MNKIQVGLTVGPVGRFIRFLLGLLILLIVVSDVLSSSHGHSLADYLMIALSFVGLVLIYSAAFLFLVPTVVGRNAWWATVIFVLPTMFLIIAPGINPELQVGNWLGYPVLDHPFMLALLTYLGVSFLLQWWDKYGGCEVIAIPKIVFRKSCASYCVPLLPIDIAEKKIGEWRSRNI